MRYFTFFFKKHWSLFPKTEKFSEMTIFKYQHFLNNRNHPLAVLKEEASDSLLPVYQV
jgi:hypothetical protein